MTMLLKLIILCFSISTAFGATLEDVRVLDLRQGKGMFEVKLQTKHASEDHHFYVEIVQEDEKAFEKLALVLKKMKQKGNFKLNLNIISFSDLLSGSSYRSDSVKFSGSAEGESLR